MNIRKENLKRSNENTKLEDAILTTMSNINATLGVSYLKKMLTLHIFVNLFVQQ